MSSWPTGCAGGASPTERSRLAGGTSEGCHTGRLRQPETRVLRQPEIASHDRRRAVHRIVVLFILLSPGVYGAGGHRRTNGVQITLERGGGIDELFDVGRGRGIGLAQLYELVVKLCARVAQWLCNRDRLTRRVGTQDFTHLVIELDFRSS